MAALGPFAIDWADSPARRLHPLAKLAALLAFSLAATLGPAWSLLPLAALTGGALVAAGVFRAGLVRGSRDLARHARFLLPLSLFVLVFRLFDPWGHELFAPAGLPEALLYLGRLLLVFGWAEAYFRSTSAEELAAATSLAARRLARRDDIDPGFYLALAVSFIPRSFASWERAREAALARGHGGRKGRRPRLRSSLAILESFVANGIRGALATSEALEARCYSSARAYAALPFRARDWALLLASTAVAGLALAL